jgi:hypothetical protein
MRVENGGATGVTTRTMETAEWVDWFNTRRLLEPIGCGPPAEHETRYYEQTKAA